MIRCFHMNKADKDCWLSLLFDLYHANMQHIAPSALPYQQERSHWLSEVSPGLDKAARQVILCLEDDHLIGYIQYYTRGQLLMVEEFQITHAYQCTPLFHRMCNYLCAHLPAEIKRVEAFADIRNSKSLTIMKKMGFLESYDENCPGFVHLCADFAKVHTYFPKA